MNIEACMTLLVIPVERAGVEERRGWPQRLGPPFARKKLQPIFRGRRRRSKESHHSAPVHMPALKYGNVSGLFETRICKQMCAGYAHEGAHCPDERLTGWPQRPMGWLGRFVPPASLPQADFLERRRQ